MLCVALLFSCTFDFESGGKGNDIANYKIKQIGDQVWMAENLDYNVSGSKCYNNKAANCTIYGRLYDWATAMTVCPSGWHIPSDAEWETLIHFIGLFSATELKATSGWNGGGNGTDVHGFSALPGGSYSSDVYFGAVGYYGGWWSSSEDDRGYVYCQGILSNYELAFYSYVDKSGLFSVRCLQD
jgi:uncharacterized protein (TIGR02145 family)